jgi:hypothetical protein
MLPKGTTFIRHRHIWFNISEPTKQDPLVLCVNFTCLDEECPDDECPITRAEYNWIEENYPTTVAFSRAQLWDATKLEACLQSGALRKPRQGDVPANTVLKVIKVALVSRELNPEFRAFLKI